MTTEDEQGVRPSRKLNLGGTEMKENTNTATLAENSLPESSGQKFSVDRILAPTDFSPNSEKAVAYAVQFRTCSMPGLGRAIDLKMRNGMRTAECELAEDEIEQFRADYDSKFSVINTVHLD
jgi:hypothetical protein